MASKDTVNKVKSLLEGHCYGPLREAAEKWLAVADEKYDIKEKADKAWDKINEAADKYSEASEKFNAKMADLSEDVGEAYEKIAEKAAPVTDKIQEKAAPVVDKASEKLLEVELIRQLKEGICSVGDLLDTFGSKEATEKFGEDFAAKMKEHAEELKKKGEEFCDCDACKKARSILKDLEADIEAKVEEIKAEEAKTEEAKAEEAAEESQEDNIPE